MKMIAAILVSTFVFGSVNAQAPDHLASLNGAAESPNPAMASPAMANADAKRDAKVDKHIKDLRGKLKITSAEESQWNVVAEAMRDNAQSLDRAIDGRDASVTSATAIDNLNSYADIAQVHATTSRSWRAPFPDCIPSCPKTSGRRLTRYSVIAAAAQAKPLSSNLSVSRRPAATIPAVRRLIEDPS